MALHIYYHDPDDGTIEITGAIKYGNGDIRLTMTAEQGAVSTDTLIVEDPDGIYNFRGLRNIWATEDAADFTRVYTGWVWVKDVDRGDFYRTGAARRWTLQVQDINHALYQYVMAGNDTDRPEESDVERVQWLLSTGEAAPIADTTTYVFTDRPVDMDANPDPGYNGQEFQAVLNDCAEQSGKNYFLLDVFDDPDYDLAIWYGHDDLDEFVSEATISNDLDDIDNVTVFWADVPAKLTRDPSRVWSGVFGSFDGGWVYVQDAGTVADFAHRDTTASWPNVKSATKATARANRMLADLNTEDDAVTVSIWSMQPSQANIFRAGHRVNGVKFTHFPGWETGRDVRIVRKTLIDQSVGLYRMELDLLPMPLDIPLSCPATLIGIQSSGWDSGQQLNVFDTPPITFTPVPTPVDPEKAWIAITLWAGANQTEPVWRGTQTATTSGYTEWMDSRTGWVGDASSIALAGYKAVAAEGSPGSFTATWTGGGTSSGAQSWRAVALGFNTNATAPVQVSSLQDGSGDTVTFGVAPTPGNLLVLAMFTEQGGGFAPPDPPTGWTSIESGVFVNNVNNSYIELCVRCVQPGDGTTIDVGESSFSHWQQVSEWAIT